MTFFWKAKESVGSKWPSSCAVLYPSLFIAFFVCLSLCFHCWGWLSGADQVTLLVWQVRWINTCWRNLPTQTLRVLGDKATGTWSYFYCEISTFHCTNSTRSKFIPQNLSLFFQPMFSTAVYSLNFQRLFWQDFPVNNTYNILIEMLWLPHEKEGKKDFHGNDFSALMASPNSRCRLLALVFLHY